MSESIRYKGKTYPSLFALHAENASADLSYNTFRKRIHAGWPAAKALQTPVRKRQYIKITETVEYDGKQFTSLQELSAACGVAYPSLYRRWRLGVRGEELVAPTAWEASTIKPVVKGKQYSSLAELTNVFNIPYNTAYRRWRRGWSHHEIAYGKPQKKKKRYRQTRAKRFGIVFRGKKFKSIAALCHAYGVKPRTFHDRHDQRGYNIEQSLGLEPLPDKRKKQYQVSGKTYDSKKALLSAFNVSEATFDARFKRGYTLEQNLCNLGII